MVNSAPTDALAMALPPEKALILCGGLQSSGTTLVSYCFLQRGDTDGVLDADKLAGAAKDSETRLAGFVFGPNDISRETRIRMQPGRAAMIPMITHCILATRAHGLEILDGPYSDISNIDGFATECAQGRDLGFDGKTLIHPSHIEACNAIFTPPAEEVAEARKIIAAFERPENASRGAIQLDGRMVERLHADMARRTIAIADAIAAMAN